MQVRAGKLAPDAVARRWCDLAGILAAPQYERLRCDVGCLLAYPSTTVL
jgi:hypothetical protein